MSHGAILVCLLIDTLVYIFLNLANKKRCPLHVLGFTFICVYMYLCVFYAFCRLSGSC